MSRRRRGSSRPLLTLLVLIVVVLPLLAAAGLYFFVDPNSFKPRIEAAAQAAIGREVSLRGPIAIAFSLTPTLQADDVGLANPPGFSRPELATLGRVEAQLSLWPLLRGRFEIVRLVLIKPDVMLETDGKGGNNWQLSPRPTAPAASAPAAPSPSQPASPPGVPRFAIASLRVEGGRLAWRDGGTGASRALDITSFDATEADPDAPISATADVTMEGHQAAVSAELGSFARLLAPPAATDIASPWPVQVVVRSEGARLAASGSVAQPLLHRGYALTLDASAPDLAVLGPLVGRSLPALHDVSASAKVSDASGMPLLSALVLQAGASDLQASAPGLRLDRVEISAPAIDQPIHAEIAGTLAGAPLQAAADLGAISTLLPGAAASGTPFPVSVSAQAAAASFTAKGGITSPATLAGLDVAISARVPDLAALGPLAGRPLPALHGLAFDGRLSDREGGYATGVVLRGATLTLPEADLAGDLTVGFGPRLSLQGNLSGKRVDLDGLQAAMPAPAPVAPAPAAAPAPAPASPLPPAPPPLGPATVISDRPLNLGFLNLLDADLRLSVADVHSGGVDYRDLAGRIVLDQGRLALDPFAATLPGGKMDGTLTLDGREAPPPITLSLAAPGLALKPLLSAFGLPDDVSGTIDVNADLTAAGRTPHAIAASLSGKLGLAMPNGDVDNRLLANLAGVLRVARLPPELLAGNGAGRTALRCFALRLDASHGAGTVSSFVLDTPRALVQGGGDVDLGKETLGLRLRPMVRTGGPGIVVPVLVTGSFRKPNVTLDSGKALQGLAGGLAGSLGGGLAGLARNPLGALAGVVAGERGGDACGPALAAARAARPAAR